MAALEKIKRYVALNGFKTICLTLILLLAVIRIKKEDKAYPSGDGVEYSLMTEAFYNHFTPEVRESDCESFRQQYAESASWDSNEKKGIYEAVEAFVKRKDLKNLDFHYAFFNDQQGRKYSVHFWMYSFTNLPARWICGMFGLSPLRSFHITNLFFILISCFLFLKLSRFNEWVTAGFCFLFFFSTNYWYISWPHPEVFTVCFASLGIWIFYNKNRYVGILLAALAATQNQPLAILPLVLCLIVIFEKGISIKNLVKLFACSFFILLPPIFYYLHYGTTNLIGFQGALSTSHITVTRILGFFFDINQGMILALPFILPLYLLLYIRKVIYIKRVDVKWDLWLLPAVVVIICGASTIDNWNHGQAVVNRYVTYVSAIVLTHFFFLLMELKSENQKRLLLSVAALTQIITVLYHQTMEKYDWSSNNPKPISNWVLTNIPSMYHPDPIIFNSRYADGIEMDPATSPSYFMKEDGEITKFLVHKDYVSNLKQFGFSGSQIDSITPFLSYIMEWAYIDVNKDFKPGLPAAELKKVDNEKRIAKQVKTIKASPGWYEAVKKKAVDQGVSEEDMLREDAAYTLHIQLPARPKSKKERISETIEKIKAAPEWLKLIETKAKEHGISLDSALVNDATWMIEQEDKKQ